MVESVDRSAAPLACLTSPTSASNQILPCTPPDSSSCTRERIAFCLGPLRRKQAGILHYALLKTAGIDSEESWNQLIEAGHQPLRCWIQNSLVQWAFVHALAPLQRIAV